MHKLKLLPYYFWIHYSLKLITYPEIITFFPVFNLTPEHIMLKSVWTDLFSKTVYQCQIIQNGEINIPNFFLEVDLMSKTWESSLKLQTTSKNTYHTTLTFSNEAGFLIQRRKTTRLGNNIPPINYQARCCLLYISTSIWVLSTSNTGKICFFHVF